MASIILQNLSKSVVIDADGYQDGYLVDAIEYATLEWVDRFTNRRLLKPIGYVGQSNSLQCAILVRVFWPCRPDSCNRVSGIPGRFSLTFGRSKECTAPALARNSRGGTPWLGHFVVFLW